MRRSPARSTIRAVSASPFTGCSHSRRRRWRSPIAASTTRPIKWQTRLLLTLAFLEPVSRQPAVFLRRPVRRAGAVLLSGRARDSALSPAPRASAGLADPDAAGRRGHRHRAVGHIAVCVSRWWRRPRATALSSSASTQRCCLSCHRAHLPRPRAPRGWACCFRLPALVQPFETAAHPWRHAEHRVVSAAAGRDDDARQFPP